MRHWLAFPFGWMYCTVVGDGVDIGAGVVVVADVVVGAGEGTQI
jgi:acetyltransferase-like isoleucine patch superfamily enzyme